MIVLTSRQEGRDIERYLRRLKTVQIEQILKKYGEEGVAALAAATPRESGATASLWGYEVVQDSNGWAIHWTNDNINQGVNIAVIIQYGHGTGTGGYVAGQNYINPAIAPIFEKIANDAWNEVRKI